jgi:hypothetical protein
MKAPIRWTETENNSVVDSLYQYAIKHKRLPSIVEFNTSDMFQREIIPRHRKPVLSKSKLYSLLALARRKIESTATSAVSEAVTTVTPPSPSAKVVSVTANSEILVVTQDILVEISHLLDTKLAPLLGWVKTSNEAKPIEVVKTPTPTKPVVVVVEPTPVPVQEPIVPLLTEARVRAIIQEEIERLFGPITVTAPKVTFEAEPKEKFIFTIPSVSPVLPIPPVSLPEVLPLKRVFVFGLTKAQGELVQKGIDEGVRIECSPVYNDSAKNTAKNADLVIISKFSSHSVNEAIKNACGTDKVLFASGGLSMIKKMINTYIGKLKGV